MKFDEKLNEYISLLNCTAKELSEASDIATASISRYSTGKRVPQKGSVEIKKLATGISAISMQNDHIPTLSYEEVFSELENTLSPVTDTQIVIDNFNSLVSTLNINLNRLAKAVNFDTSYLYRIKTGERHPADVNSFVRNVCDYVVNTYQSPDDIAAISKLINVELSDSSDKVLLRDKLIDWFMINETPQKNVGNVDSFLESLDSFDLDEYIRTIHFDQFKVPNVPFYIIHPKTYYGLEGMKEGELDFYKGTVLSKSMDPILTYSDLPMEDMAADLEFGKKWMFAIALSIKKGLHLNVIHNLNRPTNELFLGLQSWIPLYMTGQITPYYFKNMQTPVFCQLTYVSGSCALDGQCIDGYHSKGKYTLYSSKADIAYYKERARNMLSKASPLMDIFYANELDKVKDFFEAHSSGKANYKNKLSIPPAYTLNRELLEKILKNNNSESIIEDAWNDICWQSSIISNLLSESRLEDEIAIMSREEFDKFSASLSINIDSQKGDLRYTYDTYLEHLKLTEQYEKDHPNYKLSKNDQAPFRNIQIRMREDSWVLITKRKSPSIYFAIYHPTLINAIWNFIPIIE